MLADAAEKAGDIDAAEARRALDAAEKELAEAASSSVEETEAIRNQIEAASARVTLASGR